MFPCIDPSGGIEIRQVTDPELRRGAPESPPLRRPVSPLRQGQGLAVRTLPKEDSWIRCHKMVIINYDWFICLILSWYVFACFEVM